MDWYNFGTEEDPDIQWRDGSDDQSKSGVWNWFKGLFGKNEKVKSLGSTVVVFDGKLNEKLGDKFINGNGAITATVTVFGSGGANDITKYTALTMSSNPKSYGQIADGQYVARHQQMTTSIYGADPNVWTFRVYTTTGSTKIPALNGVNNSNGKSYLTGFLFIELIGGG